MGRLYRSCRRKHERGPVVKDLLFSIKAKDLTAAAFDKVRNGLKGVEGAFASLRDRAERTGQKLVAVGGVMAGLSAPLVMAFRDSLGAFDRQAQAIAKVETALKSTGNTAGYSVKQLQGAASSLADVSRFGDQDILAGVTSSLLRFGNMSQDVFMRAQALTVDVAAATGQDLAGIATSFGKALESPVEGMTELEGIGFKFSEAQKAVVKSLVETGDTAAAQGLIMDEVAKRFGGSAAAMASSGIGPLIQWQNVWTDLQETVGGIVAQLLPPITGFLKSVADGFQGLSEPVQRAIVAFVGAGAALGVLAMAAGAAMIALAPISLPFILISGAIAGAIALCVAFWPEIQKLGKIGREVFLGLQVGVANVMQATVELVVSGANAYVNSYQGAFDAIKAIWGALPAVIGDLVYTAASAMIGGVEAMINGVISRINLFISGINAALSKLPEWATGEGGLQMGVVAEVNLGRLENEFQGATVQAAKDAASAFTAAFDENPFQAPDLGLKAWAEGAQADLDALRAVPEVADQTAEAIDGVGDALSPVVPATGALADGLGGVGGAAKGAAGGLGSVGKAAGAAGDDVDGLLKDLELAEGVLDDFGRETSDMLKDVFASGKLDFETFGDFVLSWGQKFLDRVLSQIFDPLGDALQSIFDGMMGGGGGFMGGGGAGGGGGFLAGIGNFFGNMLGFDTGGEMAVAGRAGIDRNVAAFRVTQGETIKVTKRGEGGGDRPVNVYIQTPDPAAFKASKGRVAADMARALGSSGRFT